MLFRGHTGQRQAGCIGNARQIGPNDAQPRAILCKLLFHLIAQSRKTRLFRCHMIQDPFRCCPETSNTSNIFSATPASLFLPAALCLCGKGQTFIENQRPHAGWPTNLMGAEAECGKAKGAYIKGKPPDGLNRINMQQRTGRLHYFRNVFNWLDQAGFIIDRHDRYQIPRLHRLSQGIQIDHALRRCWQDHRIRNGVQNAVMFYCGDQNTVTGKAAQRQDICLAGTRCEHNGPRSRPNQGRNLTSRLFDQGPRRPSCTVNR